MITKFQLASFVFLYIAVLSVFAKACVPAVVLSSSSDYLCNENKTCRTYVLLRANSYYPYLSITQSDVVEANGLIECSCRNGRFFEAIVKRIAAEGDSPYEVALFLEGLASFQKILEKNPSLNLEEVLVPLKCAGPSSEDSRRILVSYPVKEGDTLAGLRVRFNVSVETLASANERYSGSGFKPDSNIVPISTILIPLQAERPVFLVKYPDHNLEQLTDSFRVGSDSHKKRKKQKKKKKMMGVYIGAGMVGFVACVGIGVALLLIDQCKKKRGSELTKNGADLELQQLSLSIRTTSDKKVSFEGSQYNFDDQTTYATTPHMMRVESYTFEDLHKATEEFCLSNLIEGCVFHGRIKGKDLAIKRVATDALSKIDSHIVQQRIHHHPNIIRMMGICVMDGPDSFLVLEYAKNGSLKDWIHGGLAMKSRFIASCSCFLTWNQRLKICLDVATALQHMHHIMNPSYVHRNIKSRNIFLNEDFGAKLGNFGMAKLCDDQDAGYLAPEYLSQGELSPSTDIFAYGVVLLEVLSGKPPTTQDEEDGDVVKLHDEIKYILQEEDAEELRGWIDGALGENYSFDGAVTLANLAKSCVEDNPSSRPNAGEVVEKLLRLVEETPEGDEFGICENSCKPLVKAAARDV